MPKIAQADVDRHAPASERGADLTDVARETEKRAADAGREGVRLVRATAAAAAESGAMARDSVDATADAGRMFMETLSEQSRHNMQAAAALARAVNWSDVLDVQRDFIGGSFARMSQLGECYRRILQAGTKSAPFSFRQ